MGIREEPTPHHWNYFLSLEEDLVRVARFLELTTANFSAYSIELARILLAAASEVDVVAKALCTHHCPDSKARNINTYKVELLEAYPLLPRTQVLLPRFGLHLVPWQNWGTEGNPLWWRAYNGVKHRRDTDFNRASLKNTLNAVAGLFVLLLLLYREEAERGRLFPDPSVFRAGPPFHTDRLMYGSHATCYHFRGVEVG